MVRKREFKVPSSDGRTMLHGVLWEPEGLVRAVVLLSHGMTEHIMRYDEFARFLAEHGFVVAGHDHLGHGGSVQDGKYGYFADEDGAVCVIKDLHRTAGLLKRRFPEQPFYMLGHSMGSYFLRRYITLYGREITGAIIMGTGDQGLPLVVAGKLVISAIGFIRGREYRSTLLHQLVLGNYNRAFAPARTANDWLSGNEENVDNYCFDPYCNFKFTCGAYHDFFDIMLDLKLGRQKDRIPKSLPLLILSGEYDPVGDFGKGVRRVFIRYKKLGVRDVRMTLYPNDRHELLNETDRIVVYQDILNWLLCHEG